MKTKKAQLKIQQMAIMLIAITLFFVLVGLFVLVIRFSSLKQKADLIEGENAMLLASKIANSPEFSCGRSFGTIKASCIDADKVMALKNNMGKYRNFWGVSGIEIRKIYPKSEGNLCSSSNYPDCDVIEILSGNGGVGVSNFVSLCRKKSSAGNVYDKCELAKIIMSYEENE